MKNNNNNKPKHSITELNEKKNTHIYTRCEEFLIAGRQYCVENVSQNGKRCSKRLKSFFLLSRNFNILKMKYKNKKHVSKTQIAAWIQWTCIALNEIAWTATTTYWLVRRTRARVNICWYCEVKKNTFFYDVSGTLSAFIERTNGKTHFLLFTTINYSTSHQKWSEQNRFSCFKMKRLKWKPSRKL